MEGLSTHVYKGIKNYCKHRGYKRLGQAYPVQLGSQLALNPVKPRRKRLFFRVKANRRMRIWKKFVGLPKKLLTRFRNAYVNMMLYMANSGFLVSGPATGFGGSVDYGYAMGNCKAQLKEYDEKMIVEIYKSLMIAQGQIGRAAKISSQQQLRISPKISISTR